MKALLTILLLLTGNALAQNTVGYSRTIGRMYGRSHFWMRSRAKDMQRLVNSDAVGMFPHVNARRDKHKMPRR